MKNRTQIRGSIPDVYLFFASIPIVRRAMYHKLHCYYKSVGIPNIPRFFSCSMQSTTGNGELMTHEEPDSEFNAF